MKKFLTLALSVVLILTVYAGCKRKTDTEVLTIAALSSGYEATKEGMWQEICNAFTKETGIETKFARLAHVVRGGSPSLKDRVLASNMGAFAVEELLRGKSNLVVCEKQGKIVSTDINYALILDRMYKGKLKDGDLEKFSEEEIAQMKSELEEKRAAMARLYEISGKINL